MQQLRKYTPFFIATLLLCAVLCAIYPYYQYYVDPDATAYLTISKRYAAGDYLRAINGYWSPWSCWLTALMIKRGLAAMCAAVVVNAAAAVGFLYISQSLFLKFAISRSFQWLLQITLVFFLSYAVFWQLFDDLWECFFLLCALRLMLSEQFKEKPAMWALMGIMGALAYFAKAYSFPFFIVNTIVCTFFITNARQKENRATWIKIAAVAIGVMFVCSLPWLWLLHHKYGQWLTSTSGSLNMSWYLVGHPYWKEGINHLLPPVYADSPYYWEDPYIANGITPHFWNSPHLLVLQFVRLIYTLFKFFRSMNELSAFFAVTLLLPLMIICSETIAAFFPSKMKIVAITFLLFPAGYFLINFESRYIWYLVPLSMLVGAVVLQHIFAMLNNRALKRIVMLFFAASYLCYPFWTMKNIFNDGKHAYQLATLLNANNIHGSFTATTGVMRMQGIVRVAYFSGNPYYNIPEAGISRANLLSDMHRYKVKYYFYFYGQMDDNYIFQDEGGKPFPEIDKGSIPGLKVFLVNP